MSTELPPWFVRAFAGPRLAPYLTIAEDGGIEAASLYLWNLQVAESFYSALHCLELCLRNALHGQLLRHFGRADWWAVAPLDPYGQRKIDTARQQAVRSGHDHPSADDVVAELAFGFWPYLLSRSYDRRLWVPVLHKAFPHYRGRREPLRDNLETMVHLRNRVMHHEPIHHRDLAADHAKAYRLIGYMEPDAIEWLRVFDRAPGLLVLRPARVTS